MGLGLGTSSYSIAGAEQSLWAGLGSQAGAAVPGGAGQGCPGPDVTNPSRNAES